MSNKTRSDSRSQLSADNLFRFYSQNGLPKMDMDKVHPVTIRTAKEIQQERVSSKSKNS